MRRSSPWIGSWPASPRSGRSRPWVGSSAGAACSGPGPSGRWPGGPALLAATVTAALPTAQNVYVFAARYDRAEPLARNVVLLSTLVAAGTTAVLAAWLG